MPKIDEAAMLSMMQAHIAAGEEWMKKPDAEKFRPQNSIWDVSWPTYIESWPAALHALSIPSLQVKLTLEQARVMGRYIIELGEGFQEDIPDNHAGIKDQIVRQIDQACRQFPEGAFVRLGSRSPKDAFYWGIGLSESTQAPNGRITTGQMAFDLLTCCSERIADDLHMQIAMDYAPSVWVRQGLTLPEWSEFRCFMKDRQLVGISQYYYRRFYAEIADRPADIQQAIERFFIQQFRDASHLDSVVFDVFLQSAGSKYETKLLEVNPFSNLTDPCLFNWKKPEEFQGQLRFRTDSDE